MVLSGKHSAGGESFSRKVESATLFVLRSEPSLVAKDHDMGQSECVKTFCISSWQVCATTAIIMKRFLSVFGMTSFPAFETADFFAFVSKDFSFVRGSVSKNCVSRSLSKGLLTNSLYASLPMFWALQKSLMASSQGDAPVKILDSSCGSRENGFC